MFVAELWRYPVKSMRGEALESVEVRSDGVVGDRLVQVVDGRDELITARTRPDLLRLQASLAPTGEPLIDGSPWNDPASLDLVRRATGNGSRLVQGSERFDESPLLVATDGAAQEFGADRRRFRPNIVIGGVEGFAERTWQSGAVLRAREVEIKVGHLCKRCVMTTFDPDTVEQDPSVLERINEELDGLFALNCWVARPGRIAVGDPVELV